MRTNWQTNWPFNIMKIASSVFIKPEIMTIKFEEVTVYSVISLLDGSSGWGCHILLVEVVLKLCECFSGWLGLLEKKSGILRTKLNCFCLLEEESCTPSTLLKLCEELLQTRNTYNLWEKTEHTLHACTHTLIVFAHLVLLLFSFQAVQTVENKFFVQLFAGMTDKSPNGFSFCFKTLPGAQSCLEMMTK